MEGLDARLRKKLGERLFSLGGPTCAGKDTIVRCLEKSYPGQVLRFPRITTRPQREGEVDGKDYFFVDQETFCHRVQQGRIGAIDVYAANLYGIDYQRLVDILLGDDESFVVMVGGICGIQLKPHFPTMINIYLTASEEEIRRRLEHRKGDPTQINISLQEAMERLCVEPFLFDRQIENHDCQLAQAVQQIAEIMGLTPAEVILEGGDYPCQI